MLKASLGFMFSHGFRARSQPGHHIAIIEFVRARIHKKHAGLITCSTAFDERGTWLSMTIPGSSRIMTPSKPSKLPATTWVSSVLTLLRENPDVDIRMQDTQFVMNPDVQ